MKGVGGAGGGYFWGVVKGDRHCLQWEDSYDVSDTKNQCTQVRNVPWCVHCWSTYTSRRGRTKFPFQKENQLPTLQAVRPPTSVQIYRIVPHNYRTKYCWCGCGYSNRIHSVCGYWTDSQGYIDFHFGVFTLNGIPTDKSVYIIKLAPQRALS